MVGNLLFLNASAFISEGSKVGIVGRNGSGKTTLFKLIKNELSIESGNINVKKNIRIGEVTQEAPVSDKSVMETVLEADRERCNLLLESENCIDPKRISEIHNRLLDIQSHSAEARASTILKGLGFTRTEQQKKCNNFSGGWRMRITLAGILFCKPDLLLLDEPTNYLDLEGSVWLEHYLSQYPYTVLLISHDRRILTKSVSQILHLVDKKFNMYSGNYDFFIKSYAEKQNQQRATHKKKELARKNIQAFVDRFRYQASKAKQAQSRLKALKKIKNTPSVISSDVSDFYFPDLEILSPPLLSIQDGTTGYLEKTVLENINVRIDPQDRIALLGNNGQGKSTFAKLICGKIDLFSGKVIKSNKLRMGYFAQHQIDQFRHNDTALEQITELLPDEPRRNHLIRLAKGGITGDTVNTPVKNISGGQRARLAMIFSIINNPHILILDEPTNHLDIESRDKLAEALNNYSGALILISHDSHFINMVTDQLWVIKDKRITVFDEDLNGYKAQILQNTRINLKKKNEKKQIVVKNKVNESKINLQIQKAESRLEKLEKMRKILDLELADPEVYHPAHNDRLRNLFKKDKELRKAIGLAEKIWFDLNKSLETKILHK